MKPKSRMLRFRSVIGAAAAAVLLITSTGPAGAFSPLAGNSRFILGDVDGNGAVTITDAELALQGLVGLAAPNLRADIEPVNPDGTRGDGKVDLKDVMSILRTAVGIEPVRTAAFSLIAGSDTPVAASGAASPGAATGSVIPDPGIPLQLTVANAGTDPVRLDFLTGDQYDFVVYQGDSEIWRWSHHQTFDNNPTSLALLPGQPRVFTAMWNGADDAGKPVPAGQYQFRGELPTANGGRLTSELAPLPTKGGGSGGLVVALTTDKTNYALGQPVTMTLTETNTGNQDVRVNIGCPTFYDFWVTQGNREIWRWSHGQIICLAIGIGVLHAGDSRHFSVVWNGQSNEGPPLPAAPVGGPVPPVLAPLTYQVNAQISEPDNGTITPPAVTIAFGDFVPANYFPLAVGSVWTYLYQGIGLQPASHVSQTITGTQTIDGQTYFAFDRFASTGSSLFREDAVGNVIQHTSAGDTTRYELNAAAGKQWKYQPNGGSFEDTVTMVSRNAELDTPYGHLTHLLKIAFMTGVDTSEVDYLAPGIGLVGVDNRVDVLNIPTLRLAAYQPAAAVVFPLKAGDRWTYSGPEFLPPPPGQTPALIVQSIVGTDPAGSRTYSIFDQYESAPKTELREDADSIVWERTSTGETQLYVLNAAEGKTWPYAPDPNGARWNAHMISRSATLDTPSGHLTGLLEIGFMGIDTGWTDYIAPGIGLVGHDTYIAPRPPVARMRLVSFTPSP